MLSDFWLGFMSAMILQVAALILLELVRDDRKWDYTCVDKHGDYFAVHQHRHGRFASKNAARADLTRRYDVREDNILFMDVDEARLKVYRMKSQ